MPEPPITALRRAEHRWNRRSDGPVYIQSVPPGATYCWEAWPLRNGGSRYKRHVCYSALETDEIRFVCYDSDGEHAVMHEIARFPSG